MSGAEFLYMFFYVLRGSNWCRVDVFVFVRVLLRLINGLELCGCAFCLL